MKKRTKNVYGNPWTDGDLGEGLGAMAIALCLLAVVFICCLGGAR